jgi:hypothetical protein
LKKIDIHSFKLRFEDLEFDNSLVKKRVEQLNSIKAQLVSDILRLGSKVLPTSLILLRNLPSLGDRLKKHTLTFLNKAVSLLKKIKDRGHLTITIKVTWVRVLVICSLLAFYPHGGKVVAVNDPPKAPKPIADVKTIPQTKAVEIQPAEPVYVAPEPVAPVPVITDVVNCGSDPYMAQIYSHESGCKTYNPNPGGCIGLGQACPGSKLLAVCPTLDWACENTFFTNYAISRYGSPANAWAVWQSQSWW